MYLNEYNIIDLFIKENRELYLREINRLSNLSLKIVQTSLTKLEKEKFLVSKIVGKNKFFKINKNFPKNKYLINSYENIKTYFFIKKNNFINSFLEDLNNQNIFFSLIIFGSYANSRYKEESDLDILLINDVNFEINFSLIPKKIHLLSLNTKEFNNNLNTAIINEIFKNHIILYDNGLFLEKLWGWLK